MNRCNETFSPAGGCPAKDETMTRSMTEYKKLLEQAKDKIQIISYHVENELTNIVPDTDDWGYVGDAQHLNQELYDILESIGMVRSCQN